MHLCAGLQVAAPQCAPCPASLYCPARMCVHLFERVPARPRVPALDAGCDAASTLHVFSHGEQCRLGCVHRLLARWPLPAGIGGDTVTLSAFSDTWLLFLIVTLFFTNIHSMKLTLRFLLYSNTKFLRPRLVMM